MKAIKNGWSVLFCLVAACGLLQGCSEGSIAGGNEAPVANAGADQTIELGQTAALDGTGSSDADGDTLTFQWTLMTAPSGGTASIVDETSSTASITPDAAGNWEIQLVVNDGQENSPPDNVTVQVVSQVCTSDAQCDDSSECTTDSCTNGACVNTPLAQGTSCDDGMYCNGVETCDATGTCQAGALPCPGRACDEGNQSCVGCTTDDVCPLCQYCSNGACVNQAAGDDVKDDCPQDACHPGTCDGNGACSTEADGTDCDVCGACDSGTCLADLTQADDCPLCQECSDLATCTNQAAGEDDKGECPDADFCDGPERCDGNGACQATGADPCPGLVCDEANDQCTGCLTDADCPACTECITGNCENQAAGSDSKDDCTQDSCHTGNCDGSGACGLEPQGTDCGQCQACDNTGTCVDDLTQDVDCPTCQQCAAGGTCSNQGAGVDIKGDCTDSAICNGLELCDGSGGCTAGTNAADGTPCDEGAGADGDECNSSCQSGACDGATAPTCNDGLDCNGLEACTTGSGCTAGTDAADGTPCDEGAGSDSDYCNSSCQSGVCDAGTTATCDDSLMCNGTETCDTASGCVAGTDAADGTPCDEGAGEDSDECNSSCQSGVCDAGTAPTCDDGVVCNGAETCTTGTGCVNSGTNAADGTACDEGAGQDSDWCNSSCVSGTCTAATPPTCGDALICNGVDSCNTASGCETATPPGDGAPCDEGAGEDTNWCNSSCQSGVCDAGTAATCDDSLMCNGTETCDTASGCVAGTNATDGIPCDEGAGGDGDECNSSCQSGACEATAPTCDDGLLCNGTETCTTGSGCVAGTNATDGTPCDEGAGSDGNDCNSSCQSGTCTDGSNATSGLSCDDGLDCTDTDQCDGSGACTGTAVADGTACDEGAGQDSDWCNSSCVSGTCTAATPPTCDDSLVCNGTETCNTASGCEAGTAADDGTPCDEGAGQDSDECNSSCVSGVCAAATPPTCDDGLLCNGTETCTTGSGCVAGTAATDGTPCDEGAGADSNDCNSSCQSGACDAGTNATTGLACDDGFDCTTTDQCDGSGACAGTKDDAYCDALVSGDLCRPECFGGTSGCGTPPAAMTLTCTPNPVDLGSVDTSTCTLDLGSLTGQDVACLYCYPEVGLVTIENNGFDSCAEGGWTMVTGSNCSSTVASCTPDATPAEACCETFPCITAGSNSLLTSDLQTNCSGAGNEEWRIEKTFDFTDTDTISVCYDLGRSGGTGTEGVLVYAYDGTNGPVLVDCQNADYAGVDMAMYRHCAALPAWAEDNAAVTIQFAAHSEANAQAVFLDNIEISGWHAPCAPATTVPLDEDFSTCTSGSPLAADYNGWTVGGTVNCAQTFDCPAASLHAEVSGGNAGMQRTVDASDLDGEVTLCFAYGDNGSDANKVFAVQFDPGGGNWQDAWGQSGDAGADGECASICVNLSNIDPAVNRNAALGIRFVMNSTTDIIAVDDITLRGAQYCDGTSAITLGAYTDNSDGTYTFTAQNTLGDQLSADILCSWDTPPTGEEVEATESVWFQP